MMSKLKLTVNEAKTRLRRIPGETFDFLGYTIGRCYSPQTGRSYIGTRPSAKKIARLRDEIREITDRRWLWTEAEDRVARLNRLLLGWSNYFCLGPVSRAYRALDRHCCNRLRQWLCAKHQGPGATTSRSVERRDGGKCHHIPISHQMDILDLHSMLNRVCLYGHSENFLFLI